MKKVVFSQRVDIIESYKERRDSADQQISSYLFACGFLPFPLPNNKEIAIGIIDAVKPDGIVFTGGNSLVKYGGNAPERDEMETAVLESAIRENIPVFGFCRGAQVILDFFGEKLEEIKGHVAQRHFVHGSFGKFIVNSYHNQACKNIVSDELEVLLECDDGVVEMIKHKNYPIIATMWHPERENPFKMEDMRIIKELFEER